MTFERTTRSPKLAALREGGKRPLADLLSAIEQESWSAKTVDLLDAAFATPMGRVIGLTGPPGVGKSTLANALTEEFRGAGLSVAILAVDPSSSKSGGALLGDRTRMKSRARATDVFFRSMAAHGQLGGLSAEVYPSAVVMRALFDRVIVETVGVGQSEADVAGVVDTVVLCVQPASGDSLQFMKAGIMEIPDIAIVTKADLGASAERALGELKSALNLAEGGHGDRIKALGVSSIRGIGRDAETGIGQLIAALTDHWDTLVASPHRLTGRRNAQAREWLGRVIEERFGREGRRIALMEIDAMASSDGGKSVLPFQFRNNLTSRLEIKLRPQT